MAKIIGTSCPGRVSEFIATLKYPERTAYRATGPFGETLTFQLWPNRASLLQSIRMQQSRASRNDDWRLVVKA